MKVPSHKHTGTWADVPSSWTALPCHGGTSTRSADPAKQRHRDGHACAVYSDATLHNFGIYYQKHNI